MFGRKAPHLVLLLGLAFQIAGCSCEKDKNKDLTKPPPPLEVKAVPSNVKVEVFPQKGATSARPLAIVIAADPSYCATVKKEYVQVGHVLCGDKELTLAEPDFKAGVAYLKKAYPRHVSTAPVHLYADPARSDVGWRLMLKEPGFFAHAYLAGLPEKVLTNITLRALNSQGARTLGLTLEMNKRLKLLSDVARRRGLTVHALGDKPGSLKQAIGLIKKADERLNPKPTPGAANGK